MESENLRNSVLIAPSRNFWMCRADGGKYIRHFRNFGIVGLGHADTFKKLDLSSSKSELNEKILKQFDVLSLKKTTATSHLHQILHFIYDAKIGDVVVTVTNKMFYIGRITSRPYFEHEILTVKSKSNLPEKDLKMRFFLRRKVNWITSISRENLPFHLSRGITSHQSFFSLNDYED